MIFDIIQTILDKNNKLRDQLNILQINKYVYENCFIYELSTPENMTNKTFRQKKYSKIIKLEHIQSFSNVKLIKSVNHLADTLEVLICKGEYWIRQKGIKRLKKLKILDCSINNYIRNVNHLADTLEELYCESMNCGLRQEGISGLKKLKKIKCCGNKKITDLNHLKDTLEIVDCNDKWDSIKQEGISQLKNGKF